jgi:hypothetical protein
VSRPADEPAPEQRSPSRRWPVVVLAAVGVVLLIGAVVVIPLSRYQPLSARGDTIVEGPSGDVSRLDYGGRRLAVVQYVDQATMRYSFRLHNGGPVGVSVTDVEVRSGPGRLLELAGYDVDQRGPVVSEPQPGSPSFALGGDADRTVTLFLRFVNCQHISPRTGTNLDEVTVHYRGFGLVPHSQTLRLPDLIRTQSPVLHSRCPNVTADSRPPG